MKVIRQRHSRFGMNAWGRPQTWDVEIYELEESDVGRQIHHFGGYLRPSYTVTRKDVGARVERFTYGSHDPTESWHINTPGTSHHE